MVYHRWFSRPDLPAVVTYDERMKVAAYRRARGRSAVLMLRNLAPTAGAAWGAKLVA